MIFNIGFDNFNIENYTFIIKLGNEIIQHQTIQVPSIIAQQQFIQAMQQLANDDKPMQVRCIKIVETEKEKELEQFLSFSNNAYIRAFEKEFEGCKDWESR